MKQLSQNKKSGALEIAEIDSPLIRPGMVLVKNYFSLISPGTEKSTIDSRKSSLLTRAKSQPEELKKVIDEMKRTGPLKTYKRVMSKLDASAGLGYSSSGIVLAVDSTIQDIEVGDRVACAGAEYAYHSDVIVVPRNLCVRIPDDVSSESASYTTLGAIALQGIRQTQPTLGECIAVIGLGLLGQLTVQMLKANGCRVIGIDLDTNVLALAMNSGIDAAFHRNDPGIKERIISFSHGTGVDAVIITAGTTSNDPIEFAGEICREKGRVVVVGAVPMDIPRTNFYQKEIDIRLSRSYGPGRYNDFYEKRGVDYPIGYVRWTENRNMQAFIALLQEKKVHVAHLTTHRFTIDAALDAYALIEGERREPYVGILLTYEDLPDNNLAELLKPQSKPEIENLQPILSSAREPMRVGFIGLGSFASSLLAPYLKEIPDVTLDTVCNQSGLTSRDMQMKFGFLSHATDAGNIFSHEKIGTVFIATRHDRHYSLTREALLHGMNVFVEKPLTLRIDDLEELRTLYSSFHNGTRKPTFMVGYNRRFAPLVRSMKDFFVPYREPKMILYRVNAGFLPKDHWTQDPGEGGGRVIGEICHFVDTILYLTDSIPKRLYAECIHSQNEAVTNFDTVNITLRFIDGSVAVVSYISNGDRSITKERIEIHCSNASAVMDNFTQLTLAQNGRQSKKSSNGDKGHRNEVIEFMSAVQSNRPEIIPFESMLLTSKITFKILESLINKETIVL